jgi:hypothetical protein
MNANACAFVGGHWRVLRYSLPARLSTSRNHAASAPVSGDSRQTFIGLTGVRHPVVIARSAATKQSPSGLCAHNWMGIAASLFSSQ